MNLNPFLLLLLASQNLASKEEMAEFLASLEKLLDPANYVAFGEMGLELKRQEALASLQVLSLFKGDVLFAAQDCLRNKVCDALANANSSLVMAG